MLPSRGAVRSRQVFGLRQTIRPNAGARPQPSLRSSISGRLAGERQFGTTLRTDGPSLLSRGLPIGAISAGRRIGASTSVPFLFPHHHSRRHASTQPPAAAAAAAAAASPSTSAPPAGTPPTDAPGAASTDELSALSSANPFDQLDGSALLDMPEQIGYLHAMGLDFGYGPTSMIQWCLEHVHVWGGLPWWASIAAVAVAFRLAIFLPSLAASENSAKMQQLRRDPRYAAALAQMQTAAAQRQPGYERRVAEARMTIKHMHREAGFAMWRTLVPLVNVPFAFGMFRLLRGMAALPVPGLEDGGILWFTDMTVPDPYFVLPLTSAAIMFLIMKSNLPYLPAQQQQVMKMVQWVVTPISVFVTLKMSAGVTFFIFVSSVLQLIQSTVWRQPWLRRWAGLPELTRGGAAPSGPSSPLRPGFVAVAPDATWQAPRTISTTARPVAGNTSASAEATSSVDNTNPITAIRDGIGSFMGKAKEKQASSRQRAANDKAQEYERKRQLEEEERYYRRREEERQFREMKKGGGRM